MNEKLKSRDLGISFLKSYSFLNADYVCVLHPLAYLIKKTNFNQLKEFKDNYKLIDGEIISSELFEKTSNNTSFPIIIGLYSRDKNGMNYQTIKRFTFSIHNTNYKFSLNQFLYIEDVHTKYKDKNIDGQYKHYSTLRDMNWLSINKGWLDKESSNSIRVKGATSLKIFNYIEVLKKWFTRNKKEFWFLGNLSPIVNKDLWKKGDRLQIKDIGVFIKKELTSSDNTLNIFGNKLIWNFKNINPTGKYRFKTRENLYTHSEIKASATKEITEKDFLEIQIGYDKSVEDFYIKKSIHKLGFINNKHDKKFIFELSDIFYWGIIEKIITKENIKEIILKISNIKILEDEYKIEREKPTTSNIVLPLNFEKVNIKKPSFVSNFVTNDFIEINIDYKQKAVGTQAMLFLNLSSKNFMINNKTIIGETISKKDVLNYIIDKNRYSTLFYNLIIIFSHLSKQHNKDILNILNKIIKVIDNDTQNLENKHLPPKPKLFKNSWKNQLIIHQNQRKIKSKNNRSFSYVFIDLP